MVVSSLYLWEKHAINTHYHYRPLRDGMYGSVVLFPGEFIADFTDYVGDLVDIQLID